MVARLAQNAEGFRKRTLEGVRVITYLQEFANAGSLSELSELFQDNNRLAEAAVQPCPALTAQMACPAASPLSLADMPPGTISADDEDLCQTIGFGPCAGEGVHSSRIRQKPALQPSAEVAAWVQAVTRQIMGIGQELTYAKERIALLDEAPKSNGSIAPQPVSAKSCTPLQALKAAPAAPCLQVNPSCLCI